MKPLTRNQASELTGLSVRTIDRMIADGTLTARKYKRAVRIDSEALLQYKDAAKMAPRAETTADVHTERTA